MQRQDFEQLYLPQWQRMYALALRMLPSAEDASDAVQDAFERLLDSTDRLDDVASPTAYCLTMIRRICIDRLRRESVRHTVDLDTAAADESLRHPPDELSGEETEHIIRRAIESLPPGQSLVMRLKVYGELDNTAIAEETGFSNETVRQQLSRARKKLKELLLRRR